MAEATPAMELFARRVLLAPPFMPPCSPADTPKRRLSPPSAASTAYFMRLPPPRRLPAPSAEARSGIPRCEPSRSAPIAPAPLRGRAPASPRRLPPSADGRRSVEPRREAAVGEAERAAAPPPEGDPSDPERCGCGNAGSPDGWRGAATRQRTSPSLMQSAFAAKRRLRRRRACCCFRRELWREIPCAGNTARRLRGSQRGPASLPRSSRLGGRKGWCRCCSQRRKVTAGRLPTRAEGGMR